MHDDHAPRPEPWGDLVPPNRRPPTAVGVMTPPPPRRPERAPAAMPLRRRLALAFLGFACVSTGAVIAVATTGPVGFGIGATIALMGAPSIRAAVRPHRAIRALRPER